VIIGSPVDAIVKPGPVAVHAKSARRRRLRLPGWAVSWLQICL